MTIISSWLLRWRQAMIAVALPCLFALSLVTAFLLRFEYVIPTSEDRNLLFGLAIAIPTKLALFYAMRLNRGWFTIAGIADLLRIAAVSFSSSTVFAIITIVTVGREFPRSVYVLDALICFLLVAGLRLAVRVYLESKQWSHSTAVRRNVLIYGEPWAAAALTRELETGNMNYKVLGFLTDNPRQRGEYMLDLPILGTSEMVADVVAKLRRQNREVHEVLLAVPSGSNEMLRKAALDCRAAGVSCKMLPPLQEMLGDKGLAIQLRDISVEDLLARPPVELDHSFTRQKVAGRVVLVTGAAGFIGSELCRQIAAYGPLRLILLDQAESGLYNIDLELRHNFPHLPIVPRLGDIRDAWGIRNLLASEGVEVIFHAAAYKHVPVMEAHPCLAAENNILGTWNIAKAARELGIRHLVLISTDKAVNPTSVMGAAKRAAELLVASLGQHGDGQANFVSVRFGNVLASTGSVIPIFQQQIARGGPITVTHPEMRRYFMTVKEAVQLVLHAFALAQKSEIFILDMGEPVKIVDLARTMIQLSGRMPDRDIKIEFTGLRKGEKLFEELNVTGERFQPTPHPKIKILRHIPIQANEMQLWLGGLDDYLMRRDSEGVVQHLRDLIPEYVTPTEQPTLEEEAAVASKSTPASSSY